MLKTLDEFIAQISLELQQEGLLIDLDPQIPGVQALLYSRSTQRLRLGFAKVEDHFLFIDWENIAFCRLDELSEIYRRFSKFANLGFRTPHAFRLQIPNMAVVAVSQAGFPKEALRFASCSSLNPWYGGEVGQIILINLGDKQVVSLASLRNGRYPRPGAFALSHSADIIRAASQRVFENRI